MAGISEDKKQIEADDLVFSNQIKWLQTDQKLFVVKHNGPIASLFISGGGHGLGPSHPVFLQLDQTCWPYLGSG